METVNYEIPVSLMVVLESEASKKGLSLNDYLASFCARVIDSMTEPGGTR